jgi:uncharacterized protein YhaN
MRFQTLDLVRYGGFADRVIDFGSGQPDLHLVLGPNEAGKSTMLEAIGDLLFGIHPQTAQNWRFEYGDLRIRAVLQHAEDVVEIVRRKGNRNTLLGPDGTALPDEFLAPFLGGIDRTTFERMYGLDHERLRSGGRAILEGKDDAARLILEAGSGLSGVGAELARLDRMAGDLFKPNAQNPAINRLIRERVEAQAVVRSAGLTDSAWSAIIAAEKKAGERRSDLQAEGRALTMRAAAIERTNRARPLLARRREIDTELETLGDVRPFPADAEARLNAAVSERNTAQELLGQHRAQLEKAQLLGSVELPAELLAEQDRVEALEERRPVIEKDLADIARRQGDLDRSEARIGAARAEARLPAGAPLPAAGWRKRARQYLEERRAIAERRVRHGVANQDAAHAKATALAEIAALPEPVELHGVRAAIAAVPADFTERLTSARDAVSRAVRRTEAELQGLAPWKGEIIALAAMSLPLDAVIAEHQAALEGARSGLEKARLELNGASERAVKAAARFESLSVAADLPTPEAVLVVREIRDAAVADVRSRLVRPRAPDDDDAGAALSLAVERADVVVDRRDAEADRIAEHALARSTSAEAEALLENSRQRVTEAEAVIESAQSGWGDLLAPMGFTPGLPPAAMGPWKIGRQRALDAFEEQADAQTRLARLEATVAEALGGLTEISKQVGFEIKSEMDLGDAVRIAAGWLDAMEASDKKRSAAKSFLDGASTTLDELASEEREIELRAAILDQTRSAMIVEVGLAEQADDAAISDVIEASDAIAAEVVTADGLRRQVDGMAKDIAAFEADTNAIFAAMGRPAPSNHASEVRALALALKSAVAERAKVERAREDGQESQAGIEAAENRVSAAEAVVAGLMAIGELKEEADLFPAIAASARFAALDLERKTLLRDLAEIGAGRSIEELAGDMEAISAEEAAGELAAIADRQLELGAEREDVGRVIRESELAHDKAATTTVAANAQQQVKEVEASLLDAAEHYIAAAGAAAVLRWLMGKYRAANQGPVIARAGSLFQEMTKRSFDGLALDYGEDDQPRIVGVRGSGERVGVDGMSEGTRDQLYLALRLASIDERSATGVPLICDDILITADGPRSAAMLGALASISMRTQVIVFTHHDHIVDLARETIGGNGFLLHRLEAASFPIISAAQPAGLSA